MTMVGLPLILFQAEEEELSDLEYIESKVVAGDFFQVSGNINALNDTIEFIVPNGKTAFILEAKITMSTNPAAVSTGGTSASVSISDQVVAELKISSATKSKAKIGVSSAASNSNVNNNGGGSGSGMGGGQESRFNVKGLSLVGDGIEIIEIENVLDSGSAFAEMSGYLSDTI